MMMMIMIMMMLMMMLVIFVYEGPLVEQDKITEQLLSAKEQRHKKINEGDRVVEMGIM